MESRPESPQEHPVSPVSGTRTSAEGRSAASVELSGQKRAVPPMWWSPSEREWFSTDAETGLHSLGAFVSRADSLPSDAQCLVPAHELLGTAQMLGYLLGQYERAVEIHAQIAMDTEEDRDLHRRSVEAMRQAAEPVRKWIADLTALLGTPDPTTRQEGGNG